MNGPVACAACHEREPLVWSSVYNKYMHAAPGFSVSPCVVLVTMVEKGHTEKQIVEFARRLAADLSGSPCARGAS